MQEVKNLVFTPYNQQTLSWIIFDRLQQLRDRCQINIEISDKLMRYLARKLQNLTKGDLRMVNEFVREMVAAVLNEQETPDSEQE